MLDRINSFIQEIEKADKPSLSIIPVDILDMFENYYPSKIGELMIKISVNKITFSSDIQYVKTAKDAFNMVKTAESRGDKIAYSIMFLGLFNNVAREGAFDFLKVLLRK